jgi:RNA polymerase sigma-70 factor (ECF subfamily)
MVSQAAGIPLRSTEEDADRSRAFETAIEQEIPRLFALAYSLVRDREEAREVVQDTLERALRSQGSLRDTNRSSAWLSTICVRQGLRRIRAQRHSRLVPWLGDGGPSSPAVTSDPDLEGALRHLPPRQRAVVALHYLYGYTLDETAGVLGCRPGTARSHLNRALLRLRKELQQ